MQSGLSSAWHVVGRMLYDIIFLSTGVLSKFLVLQQSLVKVLSGALTRLRRTDWHSLPAYDGARALTVASRHRHLLSTWQQGDFRQFVLSLGFCVFSEPGRTRSSFTPNSRPILVLKLILVLVFILYGFFGTSGNFSSVLVLVVYTTDC